MHISEQKKDNFYEIILKSVYVLVELDPPINTPEFLLLEGLSKVMEEYEKSVFKIGEKYNG